MDATAASVGAARRAAKAFARACGASEQVVAEIALAVSEAVSNCVLHAYRDVAPGEVRLALTHDQTSTPETLVIDVADDGLGVGPRDDSPGLGLGMDLIAQLTQSFEVLENLEGATVRMWFALG